MYSTNWERNMSINLQAQVTLSQLLLPSLMRRGEGRIVNVASTEGMSYTEAPRIQLSHRDDWEIGFVR